MVHTFRSLGVNVAVDVNSGAVHVLDGLMYDLLTALAERDENGALLSGPLPAELSALLPQHDPAALRFGRDLPLDHRAGRPRAPLLRGELPLGDAQRRFGADPLLLRLVEDVGFARHREGISTPNRTGGRVTFSTLYSPSSPE